MKAKHQDKIDELVNLIASTLKVTAQRLAASGAINEDDYDEDQFVLAKILVTAALNQHKDDFAPIDAKHKRTVKNLIHF